MMRKLDPGCGVSLFWIIYIDSVIEEDNYERLLPVGSDRTGPMA
jgi:hypothetical protein